MVISIPLFTIHILLLTCWKSTAFFQRVKLEPVKSAEPPKSSGTTSERAVRTPSDNLRVATAASAGVKRGRAASQP